MAKPSRSKSTAPAFPGSLEFPGGCVRPYRAADAKALPGIANDRAVWINMADLFPHPYTLKDGRAWVKRCALEAPPTNFAIEAGGVLAGGIGFLYGADIRKGTAEVGYWLGQGFWGRGIATGALKAFTTYGFETVGLRRIFARVLGWNPASARVLEKCGFFLEARMQEAAIKDGRVVDELLYARLP
jgi:RimJ/RimL family protein N-acetyltransferase